MKLRSIIYSSLLFLVTISACNNADRISITGDYPGETKDFLYITRIDVDVPVFVDSVRIGRSGTFKSRFSYDQPAFYNLGFDNSNFITIIAYPGDNIYLNFEDIVLQNKYSVEGSQESEDIRLLDLKLSRTRSSLDSLISIYEALPKDPSFDEERDEIDNKYSEITQAQRMHNIGFILENLKSFASIKALFQRLNENAYVLYKPTDAQYLKLVSDTLNRYYPSSKQAKALARNLENELANLNLSRLSDMAAEVEGSTLDIELNDVGGNKVKLSSFRGKSYVLLSFWSAQSKECVANNLQMKEYYRAYHRKGFEIYQVNLDEDEDLWKRTVAFDELPWINVREDDASNPVSAIRFNVNSLPANYMIDKNGEIIGKNLFGRSLQIKLSQLLD